jgi:glutamate synthase domain-containing protein 3
VGDHGCEYMTKGLVIVLGETGKNFAAGMNGGIAYVFDRDGAFRSVRCNPGAVDLEVPDSSDIELLRYWIARHAEETGSPRANWMLENWDATAAQFVRVFPREYKRVLGESEEAVVSHG